MIACGEGGQSCSLRVQLGTELVIEYPGQQTKLGSEFFLVLLTNSESTGLHFPCQLHLCLLLEVKIEEPKVDFYLH